MGLSRVATTTLTNLLMSDNMRLQSRMGDVQTQLSTGLKTLDYKDISRDTQRLLSLEGARDKLKSYSDNGKLVLNQVNIAYDTFGRMDELGNTVLQGLTAALGGDNVDPAVTTAQAQIAMNEFASLLNLKVADRHLFAGTDIDTAPVDLTDPAWPAQTSPSVADTDYYQGDGTKLSVQLSETLTVKYGILANDPAFEQILRGFNLVSNNPGDKVAYAEAFDLIKDGINKLADIRGQLSANAKSIEDQNVRNEEDIANLNEVISGIKETDIPAATVQLKQLETQIQASYSASVTLMRLSLTNYL